MEITYYGHSCFKVRIGAQRLLFDPFISGNPLAKEIDVNSIAVDFLLISHAHGDHLGDALEIMRRTKCQLITNNEMAEWFEENGWKGAIGMNHGGKIRTAFGTVRYVTAVHSSKFPDGTYGGNPGGFVIESAEGNFYFAGDTALTMDMKLIPIFCKLNFAMLPLGGHYTMDYNDAVIAADFIECEKIIGMHYDTFPPIKIDQGTAVNAFAAAGNELLLLKVGESVTL